MIRKSKRAQVLGGAFLLATICCLLFARPSAAAETKGTLSHPKGTVVLKFAYFVKGPDALDNAKIIRRLILSGSDIGAKIQACSVMSCSDGELTEGIAIDFDAGPRLNYWMVLNGGLVQYSGTQEPTAFKASVQDPKRLAGKLSFDGTTAGGPKVDAEFDAPLLKEFSKSR